MCIVIDINTLAPVFQKDKEFKPVFDWIYDGKGKVVYGGSKYLDELPYKYRSIFKSLKDINKAHYIDDNEVDKKMAVVTKTIVNKQFNDQHIVALLIVSQCKLICSNDEESYPFLQHSSFFTKKTKPKIYKGLRSKKILSDINIANCCKPCSKTTKEQQKQIAQLF